MELMVIKVFGVPCIPPHDRMVDQLKIHFLKRRNNGEDVLAVIYPTSTPGQAYVIFESAVVPGVLERTHILDVDNRFYPIHVKKAHLSEVDIPVETTLDLNMFPNQETILKCLRYDFEITELKPGHLQLKGSFLKLKLLRNELMQLRGDEHQSHSRAPSAPHNGSSLGYDMERDRWDSGFVPILKSGNLDKKDTVSRHQFAPSLSSSYRDFASGGSQKSFQSSHTSYAESPGSAGVQKYQQQNSYELRSLRPSPLPYGASSLSTDSPSSLSLPYRTSSVSRDSALGSIKGAHGSQYSSIRSTSNIVDSMHQDTSYRSSASSGSLRSRPSFSDDTLTSSLSHSSLSSPGEETTSFPVDTDSLNFILTQQHDVDKKIKCFDTQMVCEEDAGLTMVTFMGKDSEKAKAHLLTAIETLTLSLRTQEINLRNYDLAEQKQILERIQRNKDSGVMITHGGDVVKLVGSSVESFEVRQKILGHSDDRGRDMVRNPRPRRSTSVPRHCKLADRAHVPDVENQASVQANRYSPLSYQGGSDEGKTPQIVRDPERTPRMSSQRTSSSLESRDNNRTTREQSVRQDVELTSASRGYRFTAQKITDALKLRDINANKDFKIKLGFKKK